MKGLGTNVRGNKCCKNICFSLLHLLHFIPPLRSGSFPILSSWFFSPPPVLFLPEEQHYPLLSLCTIFFYFFFPFCLLLRSSPFPHIAGLRLSEQNCSRAPLQRASSLCAPASSQRSPTSAAPREEVSRRGAEEAGVGETRGSSEPRCIRASELASCVLLLRSEQLQSERGVRTDGS